MLPLFGEATSNPVEALRRVSTENLLMPVLIQLVVIIVSARLFAMLFRRFGQPGVVGEIAAGLVLDPSLLGWLAPGVSAAIFHPHLELPGSD